MNKAIVGLGSNLDPETNIICARLTLAKHFKILKESSFVKTNPVNHPLPHEFINGCVYLETGLDLESFKNHLKTFEKQLGRNHSLSDEKQHPIDLDILVWNDIPIDEKISKIDFLKKSVLEILPGLKAD